MSLRVVAGTASTTLADAIAARLDVAPAPAVIERFPDGELRPAVDDVRGDDVYVVQATGPPVNEHLVELVLLLDATCRAHAGRVTAVIPYFGYARQDRRTRNALPDITVAATHGLLVGDAPERLGRLPLRALLVTNSVTPAAGATIAPLLADAIARLHDGHTLGEVLTRA